MSGAKSYDRRRRECSTAWLGGPLLAARRHAVERGRAPPPLGGRGGERISEGASPEQRAVESVAAATEAVRIRVLGNIALGLIDLLKTGKFR